VLVPSGRLVSSHEATASSPGPRTIYGPDYYGGFLLDPDGNSAEAVHTEREDPVPDGRVDHLWIRVRDPAASKRFYTTIAPHAGLRIGVDEPDHVQVVGEDFSFSLIDDERPLTEHVHLAFPAQDDATVRAFHAAALAAGYEDHGGPGERAVYHPGSTARSSWTPTGTTSRSSTTTAGRERPSETFGLRDVAGGVVGHGSGPTRSSASPIRRLSERAPLESQAPGAVSACPTKSLET
jgi:catechol 2,3-dioxygenase-like lactoylglutathione lyase family enzyme